MSRRQVSPTLVKSFASRERQKQCRPAGFSRHYFLNPRIEVEGERATGRWDLLSPCRRADGSSYWMSGYEDDEYARHDGVWLHRSMKLTTVFMTRVGEGWDKVFV